MASKVAIKTCMELTTAIYATHGFEHLSSKVGQLQLKGVNFLHDYSLTYWVCMWKLWFSDVYKNI